TLSTHEETETMASQKDREKSVDLPPEGSRNPDPITAQPGPHPIETANGAAVAGAAGGMAVGSAAGRVGTGLGPARGALAGGRARAAVKDAYDRTIQLREERLKVNKPPVETGNVHVRKEVVTERKTLDVPIEREEVVVERRPVSGQATSGEIGAEEIRIPVK